MALRPSLTPPPRTVSDALIGRGALDVRSNRALDAASHRGTRQPLYDYTGFN